MSRNPFVSSLFVLALCGGCKKEGGATSSASRAADVPLGLKRGQLIASGLGRINGLQYTNSVEALRCNYRRGFRWFETDVSATADGELMSFAQGNEKVAGLPDQISNLKVSDVEGKKYAGQFPIVRFSTLLAEADRLGDVVMVIDTQGWLESMEHAVSRTLGNGSKHSTHLVLQAYGQKDLDRVPAMSKELGAGLLLNLHKLDSDDAKVEELAQKAPFLAVVVNTSRFTPWLADRLHAKQVPVLVQGVNEHRDLVNLARAGADGFLTERYVPYEAIAADPTVAMECGETKPSASDLRTWTERNTSRPADYRLPGCAKRTSGVIAFAECDDQALFRSSPLAVPTTQKVHIEIDAEAGDKPASFWFELAQKKEPKLPKPRETISLKAHERRALEYAVELPEGSQGLEAHLGLTSKKDDIVLHRLVLYHGETIPSANDASSGAPTDVGE